MKAACVQFKPEFKKKAENIEKVRAAAESVDADVVVFPELCFTGYFFQSKEELAEYADEFDGETISNFKEIAQKRDKIIVLGFAEKEGDKFYNSAAILFPDEKKNRVYRKTHLFYKEKFCFEPGNTGYFTIKDEERDLNLGVMICYDWRFPEAARTLALKGADLIVCPSNLVTPIWDKVMPARAVENKVYLAVANRIGRERVGDEELFFNGGSTIYGYNGERLAKAGIDEEKIIIAEINPSRARKKSFNDFNDIFKDRRPELYEL